MREEIRQLLASFDQDEEFMESPAVGEVAETIVGKREVFTPGQRVQRYEIVRKIGAGGMGEVFLATDTELERPVALKLLPEIYSGDSARVSRFIREAKAASALNHPNIITIYETLNFEGSYLIATEFIEGETLRSRQRRKPLTLPEIVEVASQISAALSAAHSAGIIHRDIKPENIMLREDGLVKVLDFGLAKLAEKQEPSYTTTAPGSTVATDPGVVMGTLSYMSPEQLRSTSDVDSRADIWSLGVVMYEAITGELPFKGGSTSDVIASILKTEPSHLSNEYPVELDRIVAKTLRKERPERYQTVGDLTNDLKTFGRELENSWPNVVWTERPPSAVQDVPSRLTENLKVQRFSYIHIFSILVVVAGIFGGAWWYFGPRGKATTVESPALKSTEIMSWSSSPGEQVSTGTFSPDGKVIAFTSTKSGTRNVWIKQVATGEAIQVTRDNFNNRNPVWSPDGSELAYFSDRGDRYGIWRIPAFGGTPTLITTVEEGGTRLQSWSPKNLIYFNSPVKVNLSALDLSTGQTTQVTHLDKADELSISPNEELAAYIASGEDGQNIWVTPVKNQAPVPVTKGLKAIRKIVWHPDSKRIFYGARVDGLFQIFVTDIDGSPPRQVTSADRDNAVIAASADKILYGWAKEESDIWAVDLVDPKEFTVAADIDAELWANSGATGNTITYQSVKNLGQGDQIYNATIFTKDVGSDNGASQLAQNAFLPAWSPDGKHLAFMQLVNDDYQIKTIDGAGGIPKQVTTRGAIPASFTQMPYNRSQKNDFSWSPDSQSIAYSAFRDGLSNIWVTQADGESEKQISANTDKILSLAGPIWSSDGKRIVFTARAQKRGANNNFNYTFTVADLDGRSQKQVFQADYFVRLIGWSQDEKSLLFAAGAPDERMDVPPEVPLFQVSIETGERRQITVLKSAYVFNIDLSNDRKQVAFVANQDDKDNLWVMPSNGGDPKKITNNNDSRLYFSKLSWAADGSRIYFGKQMRYSLLSILNDFK